MFRLFGWPNSASWKRPPERGHKGNIPLLGDFVDI